MVKQGVSVEKPPLGSSRRKAEEAGISTAQAAELLRREWGVDASELDVARVLRETGQERYWSTWFVLPAQMALIAGGVMQRLALWWQKRLVRGDRICEVVGLVEGKSVKMSLPMRRVNEHPTEGDAELELYERIPCREWPTGTLTGWLVLDDEQEQYEMTPRYIYSRA